mgnify:CR=1 FL=1|tara:strand:- start:422 stop:979 length:558 start_codon:yes stop_codon:yes gene_type:complete
MLTPISKTYKGLITISGPTKSGKSKLAEFLIKEQESIIYIATSKQRDNDPEWQKKIKIHRNRRPSNWDLIEYPQDICKEIDSKSENHSILIDSLGGIVQQHIMSKEVQWELFKSKFVKSLIKNNICIIVVTEETGWGIVPATKIGHLFRERLASLSSLITSHSSQKWLAVNGTAINLDKIGCLIP